MTNKTFKKRILTHVPVASLVDVCPIIHKLIERFGVDPVSALELRFRDLEVDVEVDDNEKMVSVFDILAMSKNWYPLRHFIDFSLIPDAWYFMRPSHQFNTPVVELQFQAESHAGFTNFIDTLPFPETNYIVKVRDFDNKEETGFEGEYHSDVYLNIPVLNEGKAFFFISDEFFKCSDSEEVAYAKYKLDALFNELDALSDYQGIQSEVVLLTSYRKQDVKSKDELYQKLDNVKMKLRDKAAKARLRAQKKYAKEQDQLGFPF